MKSQSKVFISLIFLTIISLSAQVSRGTIKEGLILDSKILDKEVRYTVYLPFDYETSNRYYPAVYLLHGYTDNDMGWIQFGEAHLMADEAIAAREIPPMILIMPDAGISWYLNSADGKVEYEDFFIDEFIPYVENKFRIRAEKRYRGIAGLSMGGFGTMLYSLKHPEYFAACAAFSGSFMTEDDAANMPEERWVPVFGEAFGKEKEGADRITTHFRENNPLHIIENGDPRRIGSVRFYIDCGDDDFLSAGNSLLHILMKKKNIYHEFRVRDGSHQWTYWRSGLIDGLKFIGVSFHQP